MLCCNMQFRSVSPFLKKKEGIFASKKIYYTQIRALIAAAVAYFNKVRLEAGEGVIYG